MQLPESVEKIINTLENAGFEAYAVGGCVRDTILGRTPNDWDVTTNARPEEVKALFRRTIDTGIEHGTVTVMDHHEGFEVTTFRIDGAYKDSRHPESVEFTPDLREDLRRRDFTINAMAYSHKTGIVDLFGGREDLKNGIVRAVGNPTERFTEDALRIMRCVRFAAQLGFSIEPETYGAAKELSPSLRVISAERVREEFLKTLESAHPEYLEKLEDVGALPLFLPEYASNRAVAIKTVQKVPAGRIMRLAGLLLRMGSNVNEARTIGSRFFAELKFDNDTKNRVLHLIDFHDEKLTADPVLLRRFLNACGKESYRDVITFIEKTEDVDLSDVREALQGIEDRGECTSIKELAISGRDLIDAGMRPGKQMGEILNRLLDDVLETPSLNKREILLARAMK